MRVPKAGPLGQRRYVIVTARQHPGEANASWLMEGFLRWAVSDDEDVRVHMLAPHRLCW